MSRIGKKPIEIPGGVDVAVAGSTVTVKGKLGSDSFTFNPQVTVTVAEGQVVVDRKNDEQACRALHGTARALVNNMITGVTKGFERKLEVYGVGYGVQLQGKNFTINCGKSHPEVLALPAGIQVEVENAQARGDSEPAKFTVKGVNKQAVGEFAAKCRRTRPPEPYKGKGVRYTGEKVRRKVGKAFGS
ncbi:MAG TPA: 50S ribosomal protein L6 [Phycisphaerae bacterium]|nr:50S ribosomal protein L6 [Phycisphaerae bacterium]HPS52933.1 50S ribosomal protein L6 [Phycisphaerae bacterium]